MVNFNTKIKEAASFGQPINEYDPASKGQQDFRMLAQEVIGVAEHPQSKSKRLVDSLADQLDSIGVSANELLRTTQAEPGGSPEPAPPAESVEAAPQMSPAGSVGAAVETRVESGAVISQTTDAKLSDYYGVSQIHDAVVFVTLYPRAESVHIAGDFNNWQPLTTPMQRIGDSGVWQAKMKLAQGTYRYRLVVDGQWQQDPYNERTELNPYGEFNSIVEVK